MGPGVLLRGLRFLASEGDRFVFMLNVNNHNCSPRQAHGCFCLVDSRHSSDETPLMKCRGFRCLASLSAQTDIEAVSPTAITGSPPRLLTASTTGARVSPSRELNFSEYFSAHCLHSQKNTAACDGF